MMATTTGVGFLLSAVGLAFCGLRFFRAFQKIGALQTGKRIGILLSLLHFSFAVVNGLVAWGTLFFATNPLALYRFLLVAHFFLMIVAMLGMYLVFYILFPRSSPWPATIVAGILGIALIFMTIHTQPRPFLDAGGGIDFNFSHSVSVLLSYVLFIGIGSFFAIFSYSFLQAKSREVRVVSFVLAALAVFGIINIFVRFLLPSSVGADILRTRIFDIGLTLIGVIFISVFVFPPIIINWLSKRR